MTIQKLLEAHVEKEADRYVCTQFPNALEATHASTFKAGAQSLAPLLLAAVEAVQYYADYMDGNNPEFISEGWQKYPSPQKAKETLSLIAASLKREG